MYLTGFADEAASGIEGQIAVCKELGFRFIDLRSIDSVNLVNLSDRSFSLLKTGLAEAGLSVSTVGSEVANWGKKITDPPDASFDEMRRAVPRMHALNTRMIRVMSFYAPLELMSNPEVEREVIRRMREIVRIAADGGIICIHENCDTWGGRSFEHTLRLLEALDSPSFKLVFDIGNPVFHLDIRGQKPYGYQNPLDFFRQVREHIVHVHIKDGRRVGAREVFTFPGEGDAQCEEILRELSVSGYDGGFSIEPHMAVVFHDASVTAAEEIRRSNFVEYALRTRELLRKVGYRL